MAVQYAWVGRHGIMWHGRKIFDYPLPGDEEDILSIHIQRAIKRDNWYNTDELEVYICGRQRLRYGTTWCFSFDCAWCHNQRAVWG